MGQVTFASLREALTEKDKLACLHALLTEVAQKRLSVREGVQALLR